MSETLQLLARRPYRAPSLTVYGDVRTITRTVGNKGNLDGGAFGAKTSDNS